MSAPQHKSNNAKNFSILEIFDVNQTNHIITTPAHIVINQINTSLLHQQVVMNG